MTASRVLSRVLTWTLAATNSREVPLSGRGPSVRSVKDTITYDCKGLIPELAHAVSVS